MAVNTSRSPNQELSMGIADGSVKRLTPDRGGDVTSDDDLLKPVLASIYDAVASDSVARAVSDRITKIPHVNHYISHEDRPDQITA